MNITTMTWKLSKITQKIKEKKGTLNTGVQTIHCSKHDHCYQRRSQVLQSISDDEATLGV